MDRADCVASISVLISSLQQIGKCVEDSISEKDIPSIVDCMHKFYTGYGAISANILSYNGILTEDEVLKYLTTLAKVESEFKNKTNKAARSKK